MNKESKYEKYLDKFMDSKLYYHSTTKQNAKSILISKKLKPDRDGFIYLSETSYGAWDARKSIDQTEILEVSGNFKLIKSNEITDIIIKKFKKDGYDGIIWGSKRWIILWNIDKISNIKFYKSYKGGNND